MVGTMKANSAARAAAPADFDAVWTKAGAVPFAAGVRVGAVVVVLKATAATGMGVVVYLAVIGSLVVPATTGLEVISAATTGFEAVIGSLVSPATTGNEVKCPARTGFEAVIGSLVVPATTGNEVINSATTGIEKAIGTTADAAVVGASVFLGTVEAGASVFLGSEIITAGMLVVMLVVLVVVLFVMFMVIIMATGGKTGGDTTVWGTTGRGTGEGAGDEHWPVPQIPATATVIKTTTTITATM
jgi:hypothetical protein